MQNAPDIQLPSLPEVTLRVLEACQQERSYRSISQIVSADTALCARILSLANSALYGHPDSPVRCIEQALMRLGTRRFHTLVLTASLRQLLYDLGADQWQQLRDFWSHSLTTALTARALATLTRYEAPEEAFMLGVLHNIGELMALQCADPERRQQLLEQQAELASQLVRAWGLGELAADAMLYQQARPRDIRDAAHLVKLINLSTRLALSDAAGIAAAGTIFGLSDELTRELNRRIGNEVTGVAESLGIALNGQYQPDGPLSELRQKLLHHASVSEAMGLEPSDAPRLEALARACNSLAVVTAAPVMFFGFTGDSLDLLAFSQGNFPAITTTGDQGDSALTRAFQQQETTDLDDHPSVVLDRQLLSLLGTHSLMAVPVESQQVCFGVYIVGTDSPAPRPLAELCTQFTERLGKSFNHPPDERLSKESESLQLQARIHEVSNPLTIVRQYIYRLRQTLDDPHIRADLDIIREELERASGLLLQISDRNNESPPAQTGAADLNQEIGGLLNLLRDSLFSNEAHTLAASLSDEFTGVTVSPASCRQIIVNLVRNAAEAIAGQDQGEVHLVTRAPVWQSGQDWVELEISDNAGGLPDAVRQAMFQPVESGKGPGHSGLGLSIVKQLVDETGGMISCRTSQTGTQFRILFPVDTGKNDNN